MNDWQTGNESKITSMERKTYHAEWLEKQHQDIKNKILQRKKEDEVEKPIQGFIKDEK